MRCGVCSGVCSAERVWNVKMRAEFKGVDRQSDEMVLKRV